MELPIGWVLATEKRPCYIMSGTPNKPQEYRGLFHTWVTTTNGNVYGLIELKSGKVILVHTSDIRFVPVAFEDYDWEDRKDGSGEEM